MSSSSVSSAGTLLLSVSARRDAPSCCAKVSLRWQTIQRHRFVLHTQHVSQGSAIVLYMRLPLWAQMHCKS